MAMEGNCLSYENKVYQKSKQGNKMLTIITYQNSYPNISPNCTDNVATEWPTLLARKLATFKDRWYDVDPIKTL